MANLVYDISKKFIASPTSGAYKKIDLLSSTIRVALIGSTYTQASSHNLMRRGTGAGTKINTPSCSELSGTGYTGGIGGSGRKTLASKTMVQDDVNTRAVFTAANVTWTAINAGTAGKCVLLLNGHAGTTTSDTGTMLLCCIDSGFPVTTNGGDLTIQWSTAGIIDLT